VAFPLRIAFGLCALAGAAQAEANPVRVTGGGCAAPVHVVARDAALSSVLKELSRNLGFVLQYDADVDPPVTIDATKPAIELVKGLAPGANLSLTQAPDPKCRGQDRIVRVTVLAKGQRAPASARAAAAPPVEYRPQGPGTYEGADRAHNPDAR
jgi:hypothetical protein